MACEDRPVDVFGVQTVFINGVQREMVCPELVRLNCFSREHGQRIIQVKLLITMSDFLVEQRQLIAFLGSVSAERILM